MERKVEIVIPAGQTLILGVKITKPADRPARTVNLQSTKNYERLSIIGQYNGCWGQIVNVVREVAEELSPKKKAALLELCDIWDRWHLNNLKAGTKKQQAIIDQWLAEGNKYDYDKACEVLKTAGLYEDRGYKYGYEWLVDLLPRGLTSKINKLLDALE